MAAPHQTSGQNGYGYIGQFYRLISESKPGTIPKAPIWVVQFEDIKGKILPAIDLALQYEPGFNSGDGGGGIFDAGGQSAGSSSWKVKKAADTLASPEYQTKAGCLFCQAIDLPGITINAIAEGNINYNNFLRSYVGQGRVDFPIMRASFLETNVSFADNVLRPWSVATATFGLIARNGMTENYRTNMFCWQLGSLTSEQPTILKQMIFYDICCLSVANEELNYLPNTSPVLREATFTYQYYTIATDSNEFL